MSDRLHPPGKDVARIEDARVISTRSSASQPGATQHDAARPGTTRPGSVPDPLAHGPVDQGSLLGTIQRHRRVMIAAAAAALLLITTIVLSMTSQYESEALVLYDAAARNPADIRDSQAAGSRSMTDLNDVRSQLKIIASPQIAREVLEALSPADRAELARKSALGQVVERFAPSPAAGEETTRADEEATRAGAGATGADGRMIRRYLDRLTAFNDGRSYVLEVAFRSDSAALSRRVLDQHLKAFLAQQLAARQSVVRQAEQWFDRELGLLRGRLVDAEARQQAFRQRSDLLLAEGETLRSRQLASITRALAEVRFDLARKSARFAELTHGTASGGADSSVAASELIQKLRAQEAEVSGQVANLQQQFGPSYPPLRARQAELVDVRARIDSETRRLGSAAGGDVEIAQANVARLERELQAAIQALGSSSQDELSAVQVDREIRADRQVYDRLLERSREVAVQGLLQPLEFRVVSAPTLPDTAVSPRRALLLLMALPLSLFIGLGAALFAQWRDRRRVASLSMLEQHYGLYGLGALPALMNPAPGADQEGPAPEPPMLVAGIQSLRNSLVFQNDGAAPRTIVFSSALPGDGKTTTATLYARSIALSGERVLLIDADLRHKSLTTSMLASMPEQGVLDCLRGLPLKRAVIPNYIERLDLLPASSAPASAADLIDPARVSAFLKICRAHYGVVVIDTPPLGAVDDASIWSSRADSTVLVARWRATPTAALLDAVRRVRRAGGRLAGVMLSATDMQKYLAQEGQALSGRPYPYPAHDGAVRD